MSVSYSEVIERMKRSANLKNDSRVAQALGVTPQALSNYKKRGRLPSDLILRFAELFGVSVDWLLTGEGRMFRRPSAARPALLAQEGVAVYEKQITGLEGLTGLLDIHPDELIYVGKLLKILRSADKSTASLIKWSLDAFLKAIESQKKEENP